MAALAAGCAADRQAASALAGTAAASRTPAVSFESIDGPPAAVFGRLVQQLEQEAANRQVAVVSREGPALYRLRGYLAVKIERKRGTVVWVWDVYGADQQRVARISGEEAGPSGRRDWSVADEQTIARVAQATLREIAALLAGSRPAEPQSPSRPGHGIHVAALRR